MEGPSGQGASGGDGQVGAGPNVDGVGRASGTSGKELQTVDLSRHLADGWQHKNAGFNDVRACGFHTWRN